MSDLNVTPKSKFWSVNIGQIATMTVAALSLMWGTAVFATKSTGDSEAAKAARDVLSARVEVIEKRSAAQDGRMVGVETSIVYIRESLARIERAVTEPKK